MTDRNLEHPAITRAMEYGPPGDEMPRCPVCGEQADTFYRNYFNEIVGCSECIKNVDARQYE